MKPALFSFSSVNALAKSLAQRITTRCPTVIANAPEQTVSRERIEEILEGIFSGEFQERRLGVLGRTKLGYAFKRELREIGYNEIFVDFAVEKLTQKLKNRIE